METRTENSNKLQAEPNLAKLTEIRLMQVHDEQIQLLIQVTSIMRNEIDQLRKAKYELEKEMEQLKHSASEQQRQSENVSNKMQNLQTELNKATTDIANVDGKTNKLETKITGIETRVSKLEVDVKDIKEFIEFLKLPKEEEERQKKFQTRIKSHEKLLFFYITFWANLDEQFGLSKIIRTGKVEVAPNKTQTAAKEGAVLAKGATGLATKPIPVVGQVLDTSIELAEHAFQYFYGKKRAKRIGALGKLHPCSSALYKMAEAISRHFTESYEERIACLPNKKTIKKVAHALASSLKKFISNLSDDAMPDETILDINKTITQAIKGIIAINIKENMEIKMLLPPDFKDTHKTTLMNILHYPAYQYPAKKDPNRKYFYIKDGIAHSNPFFFRNITREEWDNHLKTQDDGFLRTNPNHSNVRSDRRAAARPTTCPNPLTSNNTDGKPVTKLIK